MSGGAFIYYEEYQVRRQQPQSMEIFVCKMDGKKIRITDVSPSTRVDQVKRIVSQSEGIPESVVRLMYAGKMLPDNETLGNRGITSGSVLHMLYRQKGGI